MMTLRAKTILEKWRMGVKIELGQAILAILAILGFGLRILD
jgi:hypothetical protein